jgi:hypothetical protein
MNRSVRNLVMLLAGAGLLAACDRETTGLDDHTLGRVDIIDRGQTAQPVVATWTREAGWSGSLPEISLSSPQQRIALGARIFNAQGEERVLSETGRYSVRWGLASNAAEGVVVANDSRGERFHGDHVHIYGSAPGTTQIQFVLWDIDHSDGATTAIDISVVQ